MRRSVEKFISLSKPLGKLQMFTFRNVQSIEIKTICQMPKQELLIQIIKIQEQIFERMLSSIYLWI